MEKWILSCFYLFIFLPLLQAQNVGVDMLDLSFSPADITITEGTTVTWTNTVAVTHTSTSGVSCTGDGEWDSGNVNGGETFSMTFGAGSAGTYPYFCIPHCGSGMTGSVTVEISSATSDFDREYDGLEVYPNPFGDELTIETQIPDPVDMVINIYDMDGNVVHRQEQEAPTRVKQVFTVKTNDLPSGLYLLSVEMEGAAAMTKKISKVH